MTLHRKRGRPRLPYSPNKDQGTPELQKKRQQHLTYEPLDLLLERRAITPTLHWCGNHFRWLHSLAYGVALPQSLLLHDISRHKPMGERSDQWLEAREADYRDASYELQRRRLLEPVRSVCIYLEGATIFSNHAGVTLRPLQEGLDLLKDLWVSSKD